MKYEFIWRDLHKKNLSLVDVIWHKGPQRCRHEPVYAQSFLITRLGKKCFLVLLVIGLKILKCHISKVQNGYNWEHIITLKLATDSVF